MGKTEVEFDTEDKVLFVLVVTGFKQKKILVPSTKIRTFDYTFLFWTLFFVTS